MILAIIIAKGASEVGTYGPPALLLSALLAVGLSAVAGTLSIGRLMKGLKRSAAQLLPAMPLLACIGLISTTWMLSGIVPMFIDLGINTLRPETFLAVACGLCALVSVLLGSSWTTIATVGVAFLGIGTVMGYSDGWIAGAIISGAYFGDKVSPLSDTTVVASSTCGVDLFDHIRNLMRTSLPAMLVAMAIFLVAGYMHPTQPSAQAREITESIERMFNLSPWLAIVPTATITMCVLRVRSIVVLLTSALMGLACIFIFQPAIMTMLAGNGASLADYCLAAGHLLLTSTTPDTGHPLLNELVATGGFMGMMPTIYLVLCAMVFGGTLLGTGMLGAITHLLTSRLTRRPALVTATTGTGLMLNSCTGDQYLSIIIGGNIYRQAYDRAGHSPALLSRTLEDSISVTSVLIPWNSCGITQSTVLGVATLTYMPYCFFNYLSPMFTIAAAIIADRFPGIATRLHPRRLLRMG